MQSFKFVFFAIHVQLSKFLEPTTFLINNILWLREPFLKFTSNNLNAIEGCF